VRAGKISGRTGGFGETPQSGYTADVSVSDPKLKAALGLLEITPDVPHRGDRIRDKDISRDAMLADAPRRVRQGNVKRDAEEEEDATRLGSGATAVALEELLEGGDPRFRDKTEWTPHRPARPRRAKAASASISFQNINRRAISPPPIKALVQGIAEQERDQVLLGVTGSGKTFTMAQVISETQRPALILAPNKTLAAQLYGEFKSFFPNNAVEYFVSYYDYYQPEAYVPRTDTFIEKNQRSTSRSTGCATPRRALCLNAMT